MFAKNGVFWCLTRSGLKSKHSEELTRRIAGDGMNTFAVLGFGDTVEFRDKTAADTVPLGMRRDGQMPELNFRTSSPYSNQSSDHLSIFLSKQLEFLAFQAECVAYIARETQGLPQNHPKEFIQSCGSIGCRYDRYCHHAFLVQRSVCNEMPPSLVPAEESVSLLDGIVA